MVTPRAWLRNRRRTRVWATLCLAWSTAMVALLCVPGRLPTGGATAAVAVVVAVYLALAALGAALAWRVARAGIWIGADEIVIRGPLATLTITLAAADAFAPGLQGRGGNGVPCPLLRCSDGSAAGVWALGRRNVWFDYARLCAEIQPLCDELNALVSDARASVTVGA